MAEGAGYRVFSQPHEAKLIKNQVRGEKHA